MQNVLFSDRSWGMFLAATVHAALFIGGGLGLLHKAEYGMDFSNGAAAVDLVAAPAPMASAAADVASVPTPSQTPPAQDEEDVPEPNKVISAPAPALTPAPNAILHTSNLGGPLGDGSSPVAGTDATTVHRAGSSGSYFQPGYYRNPPPPYPAQARKLKQEGRVILEITVTVDGHVGASRIKQSSGYPLLDDAALQGVQHWRFKPATLGGIRTETVAEIPIRFQLK